MHVAREGRDVPQPRLVDDMASCLSEFVAGTADRITLERSQHLLAVWVATIMAT